MIDNNQYIKIIDFGDAKIVDNYEEEKKQVMGSQNSSSDRSFFSKMLNKEQQMAQLRKGTFVGTPFYNAPEMLEHN